MWCNQFFLHMFIHTTETISCSGLMLSMTVWSFGGQTSMMDLGPHLLSIREQVLFSMVNYEPYLSAWLGWNIIALNLPKAVDIAVDWITDKIYWTNTNHIMVYDLQRGYQSTVINSAESNTLLHQLMVAPNTRYRIAIQLIRCIM